MTIYQVCWLLFSILGLIFLFGTDWSKSGQWFLKASASFFCSGCVALVAYLIYMVFKWLGRL